MAQHESNVRPALTETERAYLAGILDGEGSITFVYRPAYAKHSRGNWHVQLAVTNTHRPLLEWLADRFGGGICEQRHPPHARQRIFFWQRKQRSARAVLEAASPYLLIKQRHANLALQMIATTSVNCGRRGHPPEVWAERERLVAEMRRLNARGRHANAIAEGAS